MKYEIYGIVVETNFKIDILIPTTPKISMLKIINYPLQLYNPDQIKNKYIQIDFQCGLIYLINKFENVILVFSDNINKVISSLFNIPFALFFNNIKKGLLLHISTVQLKNKDIIGFTGEKGSGKSTITFMLSQYLSLFSDDTLFISNDKPHLGYSAGSFIRLNSDVLYMHKQKEIYENAIKNIAGKAYVFPNELGYPSPEEFFGTLKKIYKINRKDTKSIIVKPIVTKISKILLLIQNLIGKEYISNSELLDTYRSEIFEYLISNVKFYELDVPNNLQILNDLIKSQYLSIIL